MAKRRRLARTAVLTAATLLIPVSGVPAASATDPAAGPTAFTGTVYLPDGETVAKAAVVDLSLAGATPFARGVSGLDGTFSVDVPETDELVTLALAGGSSISVQWTASDLYPQASVPPPTVSTQAVLGTISTSPGFSQVAGEFVAYLIDTTTNALANALSDPAMVEFRLPDVAGMGPLITKVADLAAAAGIFNDPDMVAGNEDLDDPDLIPPLFAERDMDVVTDAALDNPALPSLDEPWEAFEDSSTSCTIAETWTLPARGTQHMRGTRHRAVLQLRQCKNEEDRTEDYYTWAWAGKVTTVDTPSEYVWIWRYKYRTELVSQRGYDFADYEWVDVDPRHNVSDGDGEFPVTWSVGFDAGITGSVSGTYHAFKAKKIHPWSDYAGKLYHVSWLSNSSWGSRAADFWDGGGMAFVVPEAEPRMRVRTAKNTVDIWRCWTPRTSQPDYEGSGCDPRD